MQEEKTKPHYHEHRQRLRKHFADNGIEGLKEYEIIELFLTFVMPQVDVKESAKKALIKFGSIKGFFDADENELKEIPYFKDKALALRKFIKEVTLFYQKQQAHQIPVSQSKEYLVNYCIKKLGYNTNEEFWLISLNSNLAIIKEDLISKGVIDKAPVYPRQIIETAVKNGAHSIFLLHNHPNGNPQASEQDITITKAIDIPARILNINIYDHIIVAGEDYFSFRENKII